MGDGFTEQKSLTAACTELAAAQGVAVVALADAVTACPVLSTARPQV